MRSWVRFLCYPSDNQSGILTFGEFRNQNIRMVTHNRQAGSGMLFMPDISMLPLYHRNPKWIGSRLSVSTKKSTRFEMLEIKGLAHGANPCFILSCNNSGLKSEWRKPWFFYDSHIYQEHTHDYNTQSRWLVSTFCPLYEWLRWRAHGFCILRAQFPVPFPKRPPKPWCYSLKKIMIERWIFIRAKPSK